MYIAFLCKYVMCECNLVQRYFEEVGIDDVVVILGTFDVATCCNKPLMVSPECLQGSLCAKSLNTQWCLQLITSNLTP